MNGAVGDMQCVARTGTLSLHAPVECIVARTVDEVVPCLNRVSAGVARGLTAAGFLAYEAAPAFDSALATHAPGPLPLLWFGLYRAENVSRMPRGAGAPYVATSSAPDAPHDYTVAAWASRIDAASYRENVRRIRALIAAGDTYQVNYTFPLRARFHGDSHAWFHQLCAAQQADYCAFLDLGRFQLLSASPELFFRLEGERLETRPMKGTRPRGRWPEEDRRAAAELAASEKDRAENVMIVDLLRNDMARISLPDSVQVQRLYDVERYPTVWQMTSSIASRTAAAVPQILAALFPSGSVTGAPKVRTMQIIRELEPYPRGVYCGAIGWWTPDGRAEFNVAIRTVTLDRESGQADYHIGSGVTYGSSPEDEYEECLIKANLLDRREPDFELLETLRFDAAGYSLLEAHLDRLAASAEYFAFPWDRAAVLAALRNKEQELARDAAQPAFKVRLLLRRNGAWRLEAAPLDPVTPLRVGFAREPVDERDVFLYHKTTHREVYRRALAGRPDCDDVLLWNRRGELTESTIANVVLELDSRKLTPPIACGLLAGTFRRHLLEQGEMHEQVLRREDVRRAKALWLINSVRQWIPVRWMDCA